MSAYSKIAHFLRNLVKPIIEEFPYFFFYVSLMGLFPFQVLHRVMEDPRQSVNWMDFVGRFALIFTFAYLISWGLSKWKNPVVKVVAYLWVLLPFCFAYFIQRVFDLPLSPNIFQLLGETNSKESEEFVATFLMSHKAMMCYALFAIVVVAIILFEKYYKGRLKLYVSKLIDYPLAGAVLAIGLLIGTVSCGTYWDLFSSEDIDAVGFWDFAAKIRPNDPISNMAYSLYGLHLSANQIESAIENLDKFKKDNSVLEKDSLNVILVIGESFIKWHSPFYGYPLNTNPNMQKEHQKGNLHAFSDVVSPFNGTTQVIRHVLFTNSIGDGENWPKGVYFPAVFKSAGYQVYFWDNQRGMDAGAGYTFALNTLLFNDKVSKMSYTATNRKSFDYDMELVNDFKSQLKTQGKHNFVVFHLLGQHVAFDSRFPHTPEYSHFTKDSIKRNEAWMTDEKRQNIADFDNATRYNDFVLNEIFNIYRNTNTVLVYFPDHGEEVYDYRDSKGRVANEMGANYLKYQYDVPFFIWYSDKYKQAHPEMIDRIKSAVNRKFMIDNVSQMMFDLGNVKTSYYIPERDLLSPQYKYRKRLVNMKDDYDIYRWK